MAVGPQHWPPFKEQRRPSQLEARQGLRKAGGGPQAWEGCSAPHYLRRLSSGWGAQAPRPPRSPGDSQDVQTWADRLSDVPSTPTVPVLHTRTLEAGTAPWVVATPPPRQAATRPILVTLLSTPPHQVLSPAPRHR